MHDLPTGTVTFLFTDIEGSTRLWEQHPDAMRLALARHDRLIRAAIETNGGHVFKTMGDAFCAAFSVAANAVDAARAIQQSLRALPPSAVASSAELSLRVRVALHTGAAEARAGDYFGPALNRVARLLAVGHGAQVLLSGATRELVQDDLPPGASLRDLGSQRLRDLDRPEHAFQLVHPDLAVDFPPLRSLDVLPNNLPRQLTSFVGRKREMADVKRLLAAVALLTLTGSGGCGKTRLALQVAADSIGEFADGVWLVELAALSDPALVPPSVASALGVREEPGRPLEVTLTDHLRARSLLLVLDNCEHLLGESARLAESLLRACPKLRILASSREGLGIVGEQTYSVPCLSLPDPGKWSRVEGQGSMGTGRSAGHQPSTLDPRPSTLLEYEAVRLFVDRAVLSQSSFTLSPANAAAVVTICQRLDGIPLAIELAASRVKALAVETIAERLDDRFRLLTGGSRTTLPRQQTLRALMDWSYDLLSEPERTLLRRLSVFAGGWTLEAAEAVCADEDVGRKVSAVSGDPPDLPPNAQLLMPEEVLDLLSSLVEKSLVLYDEQEGEGRYRLLETVRQYARDRLLAGAGEERSGRAADPGGDAKRGEQERGARSTEHGGRRTESGVRLGAPSSVLRAPGPGGEAEATRNRHLEFFLRMAEESAPLLRGADPVAGLERLETEHDNLQAALEWSAARSDHTEVGLRLARGLLDFWTLHGHCTEGRAWLDRLLETNRGVSIETRAKGLFAAGALAAEQSDHIRSATLLRESLALSQEVGDKWTAAAALRYLGAVTNNLGDAASARIYYEESLALCRELGDQRDIANVIHNLGVVTWTEGNDPRARLLFEESLAVYRRLGSTAPASLILVLLGRVARHCGEYATARAHLAESLAMARKVGFLRGEAHGLEEFAALAAAEGEMVRAARLLGAAEGVREAIQAPPFPPQRVENDRAVAASRTALGAEAFAAAWAEGRAMGLDEAVRYALEEPDAEPSAQ